MKTLIVGLLLVSSTLSFAARVKLSAKDFSCPEQTKKKEVIVKKIDSALKANKISFDNSYVLISALESELQSFRVDDSMTVKEANQAACSFIDYGLDSVEQLLNEISK